MMVEFICLTCDGNGFFVKKSKNINDVFKECDDCKGTGKIIKSLIRVDEY